MSHLGCLHPLHYSPVLILMTLTDSYITARWILQLTLTKHVYSVTNVHFGYAKGVVPWKLNYEPNWILTWFAHRSYNPIFMFHSVDANFPGLSFSLQEFPAGNNCFMVMKIEKVSSVYTGGHLMSGYLRENDINMLTIRGSVIQNAVKSWLYRDPFHYWYAVSFWINF